MKNENDYYITLIQKAIYGFCPEAERFEFLTEDVIRQDGLKILDKIFNDPGILKLHEKCLYNFYDARLNYNKTLNILTDYIDIDRYSEFIHNIYFQSNFKSEPSKRYIQIATMMLFGKFSKSENTHTATYYKILEIFFSYKEYLNYDTKTEFDYIYNKFKTIYDKTLRILTDHIKIDKYLKFVYDIHRQSIEKPEKIYLEISIIVLFERFFELETIDIQISHKILEIFCNLNNKKKSYDSLYLFISDEKLLESVFRKIGSVYLEKFLDYPETKGLLVTTLKKKLKETSEFLINLEPDIRREYSKLISELCSHIDFDHSLDENFRIIKFFLDELSLENKIIFFGQPADQPKLIFKVVQSKNFGRITQNQLVWLELLVSHGADPFGRDHKGKSVIDYIKETNIDVSRDSYNIENSIMNCYISNFFRSFSATSKNPFSGNLSVIASEPVEEAILSNLLPNELPVNVRNMAVKKFRDKITERNQITQTSKFISL